MGSVLSNLEFSVFSCFPHDLNSPREKFWHPFIACLFFFFFLLVLFIVIFLLLLLPSLLPPPSCDNGGDDFQVLYMSNRKPEGHFTLVLPHIFLCFSPWYELLFLSGMCYLFSTNNNPNFFHYLAPLRSL